MSKKFKVTLVDTTTKTGEFTADHRTDALRQALNSDFADRKTWKVDGAATEARIKKIEEVDESVEQSRVYFK